MMKRAWSWLQRRSPRSIVVAGWVLFMLGCYPGYMSVDSVMQFYDARGGVYNDTHPALMTALWRLGEVVIAGPATMLLLQSGLFLFGVYAVLRMLVRPRVAAVGAVAVLMFPPVFAVMAVIWPDSLMAGALVAAAGALLQPNRRWHWAGLALLVLACDCRHIAVAAVPAILALAPSDVTRWRRVALIVGVALGIEGVAVLADRALIDNDTYELQQGVMLPDTLAILRRGHVTSIRALDQSLAGLPVIDHARLREFTSGTHDPIDWYALAHGDNRIFDPIATSDESWSLFRAWRRAVTRHPVAYVKHREYLARRLLGFSGPNSPVFDDFGDFDLLAQLWHRATPSNWEIGQQYVVRAFAATPLFRPWLYVIGAIALLIVSRRRSIVRRLAASALAFELAAMLFAPSTDYRFSHWMVSATCIAFVAWLVPRRIAWRRPDVTEP